MISTGPNRAKTDNAISRMCLREHGYVIDAFASRLNEHDYVLDAFASRLNEYGYVLDAFAFSGICFAIIPINTNTVPNKANGVGTS